MDKFWLFSMIAVAAWGVQGILTYFQMKQFGKHFGEMRKVGKVVTGFSKGGFRSGALVLIGVDDDAVITQMRSMCGVTVFAGFKPIDAVVGLRLTDLGEDSLKGVNGVTRKAVLKAQENYVAYVGGEKEEAEPGGQLQAALE